MKMITKMDNHMWAFDEAIRRGFVEHLWYIVKITREIEEVLLVFPGTDGIMVSEVETTEEK